MPVGHCLRYYRDGHLSTPLPLAGANGTPWSSIFFFFRFFFFRFLPSFAPLFSSVDSFPHRREGGREEKRLEVEKCYFFESWKQKGGGEAGKSTERKIINNDELLASSLHSLAELWFIIRDGRGGRGFGYR